MEQTISFPGLGLEFTMDRVALTLFGHNIYWYGVIIAAGFLLAVAYCSKKAPAFGVDGEKFTDMLFFAVPIGIIGARAYYVLFNLSVALEPDGSFNWGRAIAIWDGGLAIYGGIIAAVATVVIYCKVRKIGLWNLLDVGAYGLLIGQAVGRWGNFVNVEVFGQITDAAWRMSGEPIASWLWRYGHIDTLEVYQSVADGTLGVHPTFFYESLWNVIGLVLLIAVGRKWRKCDGQIFLSYVAWYGLGRAVIEGIRSDTLFFFETGIKVSQLLAALSAAAALALLAWRMKHTGPATAALEAVKPEETHEEEPEEPPAPPED